MTVGFDKRHDANTARGDVERRLQRLLAPRSQGGFDQPEDSREVVELRLQLAKLSDEARRLAELDEVAPLIWTAASLTLQAAESCLKDGRPRGTMLKDYGRTGAETDSRMRHLRRYRTPRRNGREINSTIHRVESAPLSLRLREGAHARTGRSTFAAIGAPDVSGSIEHGRPVNSRRNACSRDVRGGDTLGWVRRIGRQRSPFIIWLHEIDVIKKLDAEIDAEQDDSAALSNDQRSSS